MIRVAYVAQPNLGPYHMARFRALASLGVELTVLRAAGTEVARPWIVDSDLSNVRIIPGLDSQQIGAALSASAVYDALRRDKPDAVVIVGYRGHSFRAAAQWAKRNHVPCIMPCETWAGDQVRWWPKETLKGLYVRNFYDAVFASGIRAATYVESLGVPPDRIWRGYSVVDNAHFAAPAGVTKQDLFLTVCRLSREKNVHILLQAFTQYRLQGGRWKLAVVGSGPLEHVLRASLPAAVRDYVIWLGWKQYNELPAIYQSASCFVLPSTYEPWGLVVNEAMAAGLPVLLSRKCGCLPELCWRGINGYDFDPHDADSLCEHMSFISAIDSHNLEKMGASSTELVGHLTPNTWARALMNCLISIDRSFCYAARKAESESPHA